MIIPYVWCYEWSYRFDATDHWVNYESLNGTWSWLLDHSGWVPIGPANTWRRKVSRVRAYLVCLILATSWEIHQEDVDQELSMLAYHIVSRGTVFFELLEELTVLATHDEGHFLSEDEWRPFCMWWLSSTSLDAKLRFKVAQEVAKVYVEEMPCLSKHDVTTVTITDTLDLDTSLYLGYK